jgi:hypothetical protein
MATVSAILGDWQELIRINSRTAVPNESGRGIPELRNFRLLGTKLFPLPEARTEDMALRVFYYRKDESPDSEDDLENGWMREFADLFIAEVGLRLAQDLEDAGALRYFTAMRDEARRAYDDKVEEERHAGKVLSF